MRGILIGVLVAAAVAAVPSAAAAQAPGTMTLENFRAFAAGSGAVPGHTFEITGSCNGLTGASTFTFTASGLADGPYPGTFTETGTFTIAPADMNVLSPILHFESTFEIDAFSGTTVTGSKRLTEESGQTDPTHLPKGECVDTATLDQESFRANVEWEATIDTGAETWTEEGIAVVEGGDQHIGGQQTIGRFFEAFISAQRTEEDEQPATLELEPDAATNEVGTEHCVTATVRDEEGDPVEGVGVHFTVRGASDEDAEVATDASGQAELCYTGPSFPGADAIEAYADADGDDTRDPGEPADTATKVWVLPASTDECKVTNGGWIRTSGGSRATFGGNARGGVAPTGQEEYADHAPARPLKVKSTQILAVVCGADRREATIYGSARVDGEAEQLFRIRVTDAGEPSTADTYGILLSSGYSSGDQPLGGGNVQIR
jgi:hypothetical protein